MKQEPGRKPFVFHPSPEALRHFRNASAEEKLNWLEEARRFVLDFVAPDKREKWEKFSGR
jgi:hypothetical protein